ncbi:MAG: hypothetical protein ACX932_01285 [Gammaproteobacteria bacterium]
MEEAKRTKLSENLQKKTKESFISLFDPKKGMVNNFFPGNSLVTNFMNSDDPEKSRILKNNEEGEINRNYYHNKIKNKTATNSEILDYAYGLTVKETEKTGTIPYITAVDIYNFNTRTVEKEKRKANGDFLTDDVLALQSSYTVMYNYAEKMHSNTTDEFSFETYKDSFNFALENLNNILKAMKERHVGNKSFLEALSKIEEDVKAINQIMKNNKNIEAKKTRMDTGNNPSASDNKKNSWTEKLSNTVRNFLSKIPFIGNFFKKNSPVPHTFESVDEKPVTDDVISDKAHNINKQDVNHKNIRQEINTIKANINDINEMLKGNDSSSVKKNQKDNEMLSRDEEKKEQAVTTAPKKGR